MATLTVFEAGYCTHPACVALKGAGLSACRFPARAWLIETAHGRWLWDTGYGQHFLDCTRRGLFAWYRRITPVHFDAREAVVQQLRARGIAPRDLSAIILSHFHGDHIAGLRDFAGVPVWLSGAGWQATRGLRGVGVLRKGFVPGLIPPDFETRTGYVETFPVISLARELAPFGQGRAVPGAGGEIVIVGLPGHAAGHLGAFVATSSGWVLLAADAAWSPRGYQERLGPARIAHLIMESPAAYDQTLRALHDLYARGQVRIRLTHEGNL